MVIYGLLAPVLTPGSGVTPTGVFKAALVGGTASRISGGKFANGAVTGAISWAVRAANSERYQQVDEQDQLATEAVNSVKKGEGREYGGLIYRKKDGELGYTKSVADGDGQSVDMMSQVSNVPEGAVVVSGWHTHHKGLHPGFSPGDIREANSYGSLVSHRGTKIDFNGIYVGGEKNGSIRYYESGTLDLSNTVDGTLPKTWLPQDIRPYTTEVGSWR